MNTLLLVYIAVLILMSVVSLVNFRAGQELNLPLAILAHLLWPFTVLLVIIWARIEADKTRRLNQKSFNEFRHLTVIATKDEIKKSF